MKKIKARFYRLHLWIQHAVKPAVLVIGFSITGLARAATAPTNLITTPTEIVTLLCTIANWMFWFLIVISTIMVLVAGYTYATSNGDSEKVRKATKTITYAAVAVAVALLAKVFPEIIGSLFDLSVNVCGVSSTNISF